MSRKDSISPAVIAEKKQQLLAQGWALEEFDYHKYATCHSHEEINCLRRKALNFVGIIGISRNLMGAIIGVDGSALSQWRDKLSMKLNVPSRKRKATKVRPSIRKRKFRPDTQTWEADGETTGESESDDKDRTSGGNNPAHDELEEGYGTPPHHTTTTRPRSDSNDPGSPYSGLEAIKTMSFLEELEEIKKNFGDEMARLRNEVHHRITDECSSLRKETRLVLDTIQLLRRELLLTQSLMVDPTKRYVFQDHVLIDHLPSIQQRT